MELGAVCLSPRFPISPVRFLSFEPPSTAVSILACTSVAHHLSSSLSCSHSHRLLFCLAPSLGPLPPPPPPISKERPIPFRFLFALPRSLALPPSVSAITPTCSTHRTHTHTLSRSSMSCEAAAAATSDHPRPPSLTPVFERASKPVSSSCLSPCGRKEGNIHLEMRREYKVSQSVCQPRPQSSEGVSKGRNGEERRAAESCRSDAICMKTCVPFGKKRGRADLRACWVGT